MSALPNGRLSSGTRPTALVMGFGPFGSVVDNPAARLASACVGASGTWEVCGDTMPVSYRRSVEHTARWISTVRPGLVLGIGVAANRRKPYLERWGRRCFNPSMPDIDGRLPDWGDSGRRSGRFSRRASRLPVDALARAAGIEVSDDCGRYVCNGWLYTCLGAFSESLPLGFLHVPMTGWNVVGICSLLDAFLALEEPPNG